MSLQLFNSTSSDIPSKLVVSFVNDPDGSLGASLNNLDMVSKPIY